MYTAKKIAAEGFQGFLPARAVWERFGVTAMTLYRWQSDEKLAFPRPIYIGRFRYWKLDDLRTWEASRPNVGTPVGAARPRALAEVE
jgi:predicted DNA-binding transcriptional regulator AlpA